MQNTCIFSDFPDPIVPSKGKTLKYEGRLEEKAKLP